MKVYAISDLHLSFGANKPMEVFGGNWENYLSQIVEDWNSKVNEDDVVLIAGDISWAMKLSETEEDFAFLSRLKGTIIIIRGNHDYWWNSITAVRSILPPNVIAIQNDAVKIGNYVICGTRGWTVPEVDFASEHDERIFKREVIRLDLTLRYASGLMDENSTLICMMHFPPHNTKRQSNAFLDLFKEYNVDKVVYGHLHSKKVKPDLNFKLGKQEFFLTSCDLVGNKLVLIAE